MMSFFIRPYRLREEIIGGSWTLQETLPAKQKCHQLERLEPMKIEGTLQRIIANHHAGKRLEMTSIRAPACYRALGRTHLGAHP